MKNSDNKRLGRCLGTVHFVGIGGIGMSGIAEIMHGMGYHVQGSDLLGNSNTQRLSSLGIKTFIGHRPENIEGASYVVISSAVKDNNPEVMEAIAKHIPVIKRAEMLAELMRFKTSVAISGSHGKTTTTSMVACMLEAAGLAPTVINGGIINNRSTNAYLGNGEYLVAEADESDATFIKIPSTIGVITNIDPEHMDYYHNFDNLLAAFKTFITNLPFYGFAVACADHPTVKKLTSEITTRKVITYGIDSGDANVKAFNIRSNVSSSTYDVRINLPRTEAFVIENITLPTPGKHNILNSLAAIAIATELNFDIEVIKNGFQNFNGVKRRFTKVGEYNGSIIIDDYAHHPVEIAATLNTARDALQESKGKLIAIFQPHRYSRLENLFNDFANCFGVADSIYIVDVYSAGEKEIEGINSAELVKQIKNHHPNAHFISDIEKLPKLLHPTLSSGDLVLMMGAGSITYAAASMADKLRNLG